MSWSGYIPGSLLAEERTFLRPGSIRIYRSVKGYGTPPGIEDYPFQGLDLATEEYDYPWLQKAVHAAEASQWHHVPVPKYGTAGYCKYQGENWLTPLGTPVAELTRTGGDMLASQCGYCGLNVAKCLKAGCGTGHAGEQA